MLRIAFTVAAAGVVIAACAPAHDDCQGCTVPQQFDVRITEKDHAVDARTGQKVELVLHAKSGMSNWTGVNVDDPTVLRAIPIYVMAPRDVTIAAFVVLKTGTATIRATATPLCSPGQACPQFAMEYQVVVTVTA